MHKGQRDKAVRAEVARRARVERHAARVGEVWCTVEGRGIGKGEAQGSSKIDAMRGRCDGGMQTRPMGLEASRRRRDRYLSTCEDRVKRPGVS
jgi:hypothetical protein